MGIVKEPAASAAVLLLPGEAARAGGRLSRFELEDVSVGRSCGRPN